MEGTPRKAETDLRADPEHPEEPDRIGYSLANVIEVVLGCLDAAEARSVVEVGADRGLLTAALLDWAGAARAVTAIDPATARTLEKLER